METLGFADIKKFESHKNEMHQFQADFGHLSDKTVIELQAFTK